MKAHCAVLLKVLLLTGCLFSPRVEVHASSRKCARYLEFSRIKESPFVEFNIAGLGLARESLIKLKAAFGPLLSESKYLDPYDVRNGGEPFRRRAMSRAVLVKSASGWGISHREGQGFSQQSSDLYLSSVVRHFEPIPRGFLFSEDFSNFVRSIATQVDSLEGGMVAELEVTVHMMVVMGRADGGTSNSPEGIHQDGFDYLVPALVVERKNITGGSTSYYDADRMTVLVSRELQEGEGQILAENGSNVWHMASPIKLIDPNEPGYRASIGFDMTVLRRSRL